MSDIRYPLIKSIHPESIQEPFIKWLGEKAKAYPIVDGEKGYYPEDYKQFLIEYQDSSKTPPQ